MNAARLIKDLEITPEQATTVLGLMRGTVDPFSVSQTDAWRRACYHEPDPRKPETIMHAIDATIGTYGTEAIFSGAYGLNPIAKYCNTGDTYAGTILYCYRTRRYKITSWGDYVERLPKRYLEA